MTSSRVDGSVVARLVNLHPKDIPEHLMTENPTRAAGDFDPNAYFSVLLHLRMKDGYTLDYVYYMDSVGGEPRLYARPVDEKPLATFIEHRDWEKKNNLLSFLVADGTPDGFFQLAVFHRLAGQFYLYWHANYNDIRIVTTRGEMAAIIVEVNGEDFGARLTSVCP